jgi:hypothetical protein
MSCEAIPHSLESRTSAVSDPANNYQPQSLIISLHKITLLIFFFNWRFLVIFAEAISEAEYRTCNDRYGKNAADVLKVIGVGGAYLILLIQTIL